MEPEVVVVNDPLGSPPNEFHILILVMAVLNGVSTALGFATSASLDAGLGQYLVQVYGGMLTLSALACIASAYWRWDARDGLLLGRVGYLGLSIATAIFGVATLLLFGFKGVMASCITLGFAWLCWRTVRRFNEKIAAAVVDGP
jgi:hypothetical protein